MAEMKDGGHPTTHEYAMDLISRAFSVTTLSYEEAIAIYLRARGILRDDSEMMAGPIPPDWTPEVVHPAQAETQQ